MKGTWLLTVVGLGSGLAVAGEPLDKVVAELDAMRLPKSSFQAQLEIVEPGKAAGRFQLFARKSGIGFRVMMVCEAPAADAGKRLLFADNAAWLHDPRSKRATKLSARQLWSEGAFVDSLGWSLARDFEIKDLGEERLEVVGGKEGPICRLVEFQPKAAIRGQAGKMRYWLDDRGWPRQVVHLSASGRPWRTIHPLEFGRVMGRDRPSVLRVQSRGKTRTITTRGQKAVNIPEAWVDPEKFGGVEVK